MPHDRVVVKNGASWSVTSSKDQQSFAFKKNVCEHATVWFKIVAECKMCFWRDSQYSMLRGEQSSSFTNSISMTLVQKREKDEKMCVDLWEVRTEGGSHRAVFRSWPRRYFKNLGFSWPGHSSLASCAKLDIVKVDKTWIWNKLGAIWLFNSNEPQLLASCSRPK